MNGKLAVCGDSWFSSDPQFPGASMGEIVAKQNQQELVSLARNGCSNFAIALQIDKAIELGVDQVVVGTTTPDRMELPIIQDSNSMIWKRLKKLFTWKGWMHAQPNVYDRSRGLANIQYHPHPNLSSRHSFLDNPVLISESMNNLAFESTNSEHYQLTDDQTTALKYYMLNLYDSGAKRQIDCWIISNACRKLQQANIPFLVYTCSLFQNNYVNDINWLPDTNWTDWDYWNTELPKSKDSSPSFHYCPEKGGELFANHTNSKLQLLL